MSKLRILIADDHEVVRAGVRSILERQPDCEVCAEAVSGIDAVALAGKLKPDIVVMDITMPDSDGLEATRQILKSAPGTQVLILSMHESTELVRSILEAGAHGYILKSDAGRELAAAVQALRRHETFFTSKTAQIAVRALQSKAPAGEPLTPRERQVLQLLAAGRSNKEAASALGISPQTVESHRANIMRKLNLHSIADLVHYAVRNKIVPA